MRCQQRGQEENHKKVPNFSTSHIPLKSIDLSAVLLMSASARDSTASSPILFSEQKREEVRVASQDIERENNPFARLPPAPFDRLWISNRRGPSTAASRCSGAHRPAI